MTIAHIRSWSALHGLRLAVLAMLAVLLTLPTAANETHAQTSVPDAPTGLTTPSVSHDSVTLSWDDPGDDSINGYQVLRRSRDGDEYEDGEGAAEFVAIVDDTGSAAATYIDTSVTARTRYVYRVKAWNSEGLSEQSGYLNVETPAAPVEPVLPEPAPVAGAVWSATMQVGEGGAKQGHVYRGYDMSKQAGALSSTEFEYGDQEIVVLAVAFSDTAQRLGIIVDRPLDLALALHTGENEYAIGDAMASSPYDTQTLYEWEALGLDWSVDDEVAVYLVPTSNGETGDSDSTETLPSRPNVVLILADDLGWGDILSNNPDSAMTTPRMDGIAEVGANFTDAHSPSSACTGTRYGLLTGRYSWRTWMTAGVLNGYDRPLIGPDRPTLGTLLQGHGYRTAAVGKWHLGMDFTRLSDFDAVTSLNRGIDFAAEIVDGPIDHGFDEFYGVSANNTWPPPVYIRNNRFAANPDIERPPASGFIVDWERVLDRLTEEAVSFIERSAQTDAPFFLYFPLNAPHEPIVPNGQFRGQTDLGGYGDFVAQVDWTVGQVLDALDRVGDRDNTLVIVTSDNGSYMKRLSNHYSNDQTRYTSIWGYRVGTHQSNGEWRYRKGSIYEGGHRVPLLMQWPAVIEAGSVLDTTVSLTDVYATLAEILGEEPEPGVAPDSVSLLPLLLGNAETRGEPVVHHSSNGMFALRDGRWKLVFDNPRKLYDLEQDPRETNNLADARPEEVARLEVTLARIRSAEDGTLSGDATLRTLRLAGIDIGTFAPDVRSYTATVGREIETVEVTAIPAETDARVRIATPDGRLLWGKPLRGRVEVRLAGPTTTITATVLAADKSATSTYTVTVGRTLAITGTPRVGQILTADTSGIDEDGLTNATFSYQWVRNDGNTDSDIFGATGRTYTLTTEDEGKTILVRMRFTDDGGNDETRTSSATSTVGHAASELTAAPESDILPVVSGYSSYVDLGTLSPDGWQIDGTRYTVKFLVHASESLVLGLDEHLPSDFTLHVGDSTYRGSESMVPPTAEGEGYWWPLAAPDWSAGEPVQVKLAIHRGVPLGERPRAPVTGYFRNFPSEHDGGKDFSFRIYFSEGVVTSADALQGHVLSVSGGAVSSVKAVGDEGRIWAVSVTPDSRDTIRVEIAPDLDCWLSGAICAADGRRLFNRMELRVPMRPNNPPTGAPTISGTVKVGQTLTADASGIDDADGMTGATFSYQWMSYGGNTYTDIQGATNSTYTLVPADEGKAFGVRVSFTDAAGFEESRTSALARSERPYGLAASESDGAVVLTWMLPAGWPYPAIFQILRNRPELGEFEPLVHARYTEAERTAYTDTDVEPGVLYVYRVKGVDPFGYTGEASRSVEIRTEESTPVENSPAAGAPTIAGATQVGETLTADTSGISDADGLDNATFTYQWLADGTDIAGATGSTYTLVADDEGKAIKVRVSFTDDAGNEEALTSAGTATVAGAQPSPPPPPPSNLRALVNDDGSVTLNWDSPGDDTVIGYRILRRRPSEGERELSVYVEDTGSTATAYTDTDVTAGIRHVYRVKAINAAGTGKWSNYVRVEP